MSQVVRAVPVYENDMLTGMKVIAGTQNGRLDNLGLETGDIVRKVEG